MPRRDLLLSRNFYQIDRRGKMFTARSQLSFEKCGYFYSYGEKNGKLRSKGIKQLGKWNLRLYCRVFTHKLRKRLLFLRNSDLPRLFQVSSTLRLLSRLFICCMTVGEKAVSSRVSFQKKVALRVSLSKSKLETTIQ